jgi:hypothetical protein
MKDNPHPSQHIMLAVLVVIALLFVVAIWISLSQQDDITAWAAAKGELQTFKQVCSSNAGTIDMDPKDSRGIVFSCDYPETSPQPTEYYVLSLPQRRFAWWPW